MLRLLVCLLCMLPVGLARPRQVVSKTVPDRFRALALDKQKLTGLLGSRMRANSEGLLDDLNVAQLIQPLGANAPASASPDREFAGLFLDAAADAFEYNHDLQLRAQMDKVEEAVASSAKTTVAQQQVQLSIADLVNTRADLLGLLAYYRVTTEPTALATAQTVATALMASLTADANHQHLSEQPFAVTQIGLVEPFVRLYRLSGEKKYLGFCTALANSNAIPEITATTSQSALAIVLFALGGLADLYEITGNQSYLKPALAVWKQLATSRISIAGAPLPANDEPATTALATAAWLQFSFKLLRITGEPQYGDQLERTIYNQILAGQDGRNGNVSPEVPLNGTKRFSSKVTSSEGRSMLSEAKALALLPQLVWGRYDNGIAINLYTPGRAFFTLRKHGLVQIYSETTFPQSGQLQLHVEPSVKTAQFPIRLRVPGWAGEFRVDIADLHLKGSAGDVVIIDREWKSGDTVRIFMSLPLQTHRGFRQANEEQQDDLVLLRGPQILALGKTLNPDIQNLATVSLRPVSPGHYQISTYEDKLPQSFFGEQVYRISADISGKSQEVLLVPFADAVTYRVGLRTPSD